MRVRKRSSKCVDCSAPSFGIRCSKCHAKKINAGPAKKSQYKKGHGRSSFIQGHPITRKKISNSKKLSPWKPTSLQLEKMSKAKRGEKNLHWRGGVTIENRARFNDYRWRLRAQQIRIRDNFTCQNCRMTPSLEVHHIVPWRVSKDDSASNLILLCKSCHLKVEKLITKKYFHA